MAELLFTVLAGMFAVRAFGYSIGMCVAFTLAALTYHRMAASIRDMISYHRAMKRAQKMLEDRERQEL